jgi:hypothetical protein
MKGSPKLRTPSAMMGNMIGVKMQVSWKDVDFTEEPGDFPFADGVIAIGHRTVAEWLSFPHAVFTAPPVDPDSVHDRYLVGPRAN